MNCSLYAQSCSKPDETYEANETNIDYIYDENDNNKEFDLNLEKRKINSEKYYIALKNIFLENNNINIQLFALSYSYDEKQMDIEKSKIVLKKAINKNSSAYTLYQAVLLCENNDQLRDWCHQQKIHQIQQKIDSTNIYSYIFALHKNDTIDSSAYMIELAAQNSNYSDSFFYHDIAIIADQIHIFNQGNPELYYRAAYGANKESSQSVYKEFKQEIQDKRLIEKGLIAKDFDLTNTEHSTVLQVLGIRMGQTISFKNLSIACKTSVIAENCMKIAKLLQNDTTMIGKSIGFSLQKQSLELLGRDQSEINKVNQLMNKIYAKVSCLNQPEDIYYAQMYNKGLMQKYMLDADKFGEVKALENLVFKVYNIEKQHGFNPDFNPLDCQ